MDAYGFEEDAGSSGGIAGGARLGLLKRSSGSAGAGRGLKFQPKGISRAAEAASAVPISVEARPVNARVDGSNRGGRAQRGARESTFRGASAVATGSRQADTSGKVPLTGSKAVQAALPRAAERAEELGTPAFEAEDEAMFGAADVGEEVALQTEEDRREADKFDADWPPKLESELRPITLPFALGAPEGAATHADAAASSAFIDTFSNGSSSEGMRPGKRKRGVYASSNIAAAAGYGVTAAHTRLDATPLQCGHVFFDLERYQRHLEIIQSGEEDTDWPADEADYIPLQEGKMLPRMDDDEAEAIADPSGAIRDRVKEIPQGTIGKIALLKNGQVRMKVGDLIFDVTAGLPRSMYEQFVAVLPDPSLSTQDAATTVKRSLSMLSSMQVSQTRQPITYAALAKELEEHPLLHAKSSKMRARANSHASMVDAVE